MGLIPNEDCWFETELALLSSSEIIKGCPVLTEQAEGGNPSTWPALGEMFSELAQGQAYFHLQLFQDVISA